ncbi:MAG: carboxypeptidase regulatory-like domain-containing protein [Planctomycetes bacterium]|nr:carboxypeptidase regulatory-like domain-containing protein [Planctomycetota bacterium]
MAEAEREDAAGFGGPLTGMIIAQVVEVDECIDPVGTELILRDGAREYRTTILREGAAPFRDVLFHGARTEFTLATSVPDRECYPKTFSIGRLDLSGAPPSAGISVALIHVHFLSGTVQDATTSAPIEGATVEVDSFVLSAAQSAADGSYRLNLPDPTGTLIVSAPGFQELLWHYPEETPTGLWLPDRRDFELLPDRLTAWLEVQAFRQDGEPAAGAELEVEGVRIDPIPTEVLAGLRAEERMSFLASLDGEVEGLGPVVGAREPLVQALDEKGEARLRLLVPGRYRVQVRAGEELACGGAEVAARERREIVLCLERAAELRVRVLARGQPVAGAAVVVDAPSWPAERRAETGSGGEAVFRGLVPGTALRVWIASREWRLPVREAMLPAQGGVETVVLEPEAVFRAPARGQVLDARTGRPIAGAEVLCLAAGRLEPAAVAATRADGRFEVEGEQGGVIRARAWGYCDGSVVCSAAGGELPPLRLEPIGSGDAAVAVRALDPSGAPVPGADVLLTCWIRDREGAVLGRTRAELRSDAGGLTPPCSAAAPGLGSIVLAIEAFAEGPAGRRAGVLQLEAGAGASLVADVLLGAEVEVSGRVVLDSFNLPAARVELLWCQTLAPAGARPAPRWCGPLETAADGTFVLRGVRPGRLWLRAQAPFRGAERELDVPPAGLRDLQIELEPLAEVQVTVVDAEDGRTLERRSFMVPASGLHRLWDLESAQRPVVVSAAQAREGLRLELDTTR